MRPFLYTTANNIFKNELRAKKAVVSYDLLTESGFEITDETVSIEERTEARLLMQKLPLLPPHYHEVLVLRFVDGLSPQEIGEALGERSATVSVRIHRALHKLRELHEHHE
jgi:RNA polymerase sigma factor (sigma-70 family)